MNTETPMLTINNVTKIFMKGTVNAKTALDSLSLTINRGDFITVIGGNGAGKSTMLNAIAPSTSSSFLFSHSAFDHVGR